jgi:UDP-N-acetylmuramate--alanine ligase
LVEGRYNFTLNTPSGIIENLVLGVPGLLNVENAVAASSMALMAGVAENELRVALASFSGIKRRFDYWIKENQFCLIDDYAHHPAEIKATANSVRAIYPNKKIVAVFQPHLYSRTNDFYVDFAAALSLFDEVFLLDIYPARELPIPGVTSHLIANLIKSCPAHVIKKVEIGKHLLSANADVVLTMGAGDIDLLLPELASFLKREKLGLDS